MNVLAQSRAAGAAVRMRALGADTCRLWFIVLAALPLAAPFPSHAQRMPVLSPTSVVEAKLIVLDDKVLPGVPFDMWIEVRNLTDTAVHLGLCADMLVKPEGGEPFTIWFGGEHTPSYPTLLPEHELDGPAVRNLLMRPRASETLTIPILPFLQGPVYFNDERLSNPGRYTISLRLDNCFGGMVTPQKSLLPPQFLGPVITNEVVVERITPTGTDAVVWKRMQELSKGKWISTEWGDEIVSEIVSKYPDSNYYPYALLACFGCVDTRAYARTVDALKRFPSSPVIELLELEALYTCSKAGKPLAVYRAHHEKVKGSKRPTTRIRAFGRENVPPPPCSRHHDCEDSK